MRPDARAWDQGRAAGRTRAAPPVEYGSRAGGYALAVVRAADVLTLARAVAAVPVGALIACGRHRAASIAFAAAGVTDLIDGPLARRNGGTALGRQLDPLADKLVTDVALIALAVRGRVSWLVVALLIGRDLLVSALRAADGSALTPTMPARWKTGLLYLSVTALLGAPVGSAGERAARVGLTSALGLAALSGWQYVKRRLPASPGSRSRRAQLRSRPRTRCPGYRSLRPWPPRY